MKITKCWIEPDRDDCPNVYDDNAISSCDYHGHRATVVMWQSDYDALLKDLAEYKALIKTCDRCNAKDFHEFVRCGSLGLDYCESCFDEMGEK
jgi:hypothetical protein